MLEEIVKIRQSGIEVEFTQRIEAVKVILAEEEIGETSAICCYLEKNRRQNVALLSCNIDDSIRRTGPG